MIARAPHVSEKINPDADVNAKNQCTRATLSARVTTTRGRVILSEALIDVKNTQEIS